jgi:hypothetical protein
MPTGHGEAGTKLLSSFEDGHYSNQIILHSMHVPYPMRSGCKPRKLMSKDPMTSSKMGAKVEDILLKK